MWSFGAILVELYIGQPIFPGESESEQMAYIMEFKGSPPINVLEKSTWRKLFFKDDMSPIPFWNKRGKERRPNTKSLMDLLEGADWAFIKFIDACFHWDPELWM